MAIQRKLKDKAGKGETLDNIGLAYYFKQNDKALETLQQALAIRKELNDKAGEGKTLSNLGLIYWSLQEYPKALEILEQALAIHQQVGDKFLAGITLRRIGRVYENMKDYSRALEWFEKALAVNREAKNRAGEGESLIAVGDAYYYQEKYDCFLELYQQALPIIQEAGIRPLELSIFYWMGDTYQNLKQYDRALEFYQQALPIAQEVKDKSSEANILVGIADAYKNQEKYDRAIDFYQQGLSVAREIQNHNLEWSALTDLVSAYDSLKDYQKVIEFAQQGLTLARKTQNRERERLAFNTLIGAYTSLGNFQKVVEYRQQSLAIARETKDRKSEGKVLIDIGLAYDALKNYQQAIASYQQSLAIAQDISDRVTEGWSLNNLGWVYQQQGDYKQAFDYYQRSLAVAQAIPNRQMQVKVLTNLGNAYSASENYSKAIEYRQQLLAIAQELKEHSTEALALGYLGDAYASLNDNQTAITYYQQALALARETKNSEVEAAALDALSSTYNSLGDAQKSLEFAHQSLVVARQIKNDFLEWRALVFLSDAYNSLGDSQKAVEFAQQSLALAREIKNHDYEGMALSHLSFTYFAQGDSQKIIEYGQQALKIGQENKSNIAEFFGLLTLSHGYSNLGNNEKALEFAQASLVIARDPKFRTSNFQELALDLLGTIYTKVGRKEQAIATYRELLAIDNNSFSAKVGLARIYRELNMPATSITYYKQAVSNIEQIRGKLPGLDRQLQESFLQALVVGAEKTKNADIYRELADLLLSQGRILEAQQALELLKVQELRDFTRDTRAEGKKNEVALNQTEEQIKKENGTLIAFGQRLYECQQTRCNQLSQLLDQREALTEQFNQKVQTIEKQVRDRKSQDDAFLDPKKLGLKAKEIIEAQPGTILIYPLVLDDKIWLLWASKGGIIKSVEVPKVGQQQLAQTVLKFRQLLQNPNSNIAELQATGKQLYDWLIKPIEPELKENKIQNLVFSLDRAARYIPMSALFDGEKYLIENYAVSTVLSADLTNTSDRIPPGTQNTSVLALGLSNAVSGFNPLPNVPAELDAIVRKQPNDTKGIYPGLEFLNQDFDWRSLRDNLFGHKLLHIATHGEFVPGSPDASYLLLGTGEKLAIPKIATLQDLSNVSLVVLSACETALAGPGQDGTEINGISYYFLNAGAKAVMASLWKVDDDSTSQLMQNFYGNLAQGTSTTPITKAQALRQAQLNLLRGTSSTTDNSEQRSSVGVVPITFSTNRTVPSFSHPYYWAPFILIGNSL